MKHLDLVKIAVLVAAVSLTGCAAHHHEAPAQKLTAAQMSKNAVAAMDSGGPMTSKAPSLAAYSLSGYGKPAPKQ